MLERSMNMDLKGDIKILLSDRISSHIWIISWSREFIIEPFMDEAILINLWCRKKKIQICEKPTSFRWGQKIILISLLMSFTGHIEMANGQFNGHFRQQL